MKFKSLKSNLNHLDNGLLLVIALSVMAAWPFILRGSLPRETDAELHVFRTAELGYALRAGAIYPRWAADFYYGYGYPIFNYYAPLTYYLANLLSLAIPGGAVFGTKAVFVLSFIIAGFSIYKIATQTSGRSAGGIVAAAGYLFAPYFYLIDSHLRGDLAEFLALAVGPLALWQLMAYYERPDRRRFTFSALAIAALILTHNLLALVYFALLAVYAGWRWVFVNEPLPTENVSTNRYISPLQGFGIKFITKTPIMLALPLVLGVMLAAFFWLPVGLERNAVQLGNLIGPGHFDYRNHFLGTGELFGPSIPLDLGAINPAFRFNLGIGQWVIALLGIAGLILKSLSLKSLKPISNIAVWGLILIGLIGLMLPVSLPVWDAVPLMKFMQFPWRLLGPAMLCVAILSGFSVYLFDSLPNRIRQYAVTGLTLLPLIFTLPIFVPPAWGSFGATDQLAMLDFEVNGLALGTTSTGDFVPAGVELVPGPNPDLLDSYRDDGPIDKVNRHTLPEGAAVDIVRHRPTADLFTITSSEAFTLRLYTFMFDGWKASIDGQRVAIEVAKPEGFITVPVPAGEHTVRVWLGTTPARTLSTVISLIGVGLLIIIGQFMPIPMPPEDKEDIPYRALSIGLAAFVVTAAVGGYLQWFQPHSEGLIAQPAQYATHAYLQGGVDLIGYDIGGTTFQPGETIDLTLYWKAREPAAGNYQAFVHLTSIPAHTWGQSDKLNPGDYPTTRWTPDRYVRDPHQLVIPPGTPPGDYTLRVGLWNHGSGVRQLILAKDGEILGDSIALPIPITVTKTTTPPDIARLPLDVVVDQEVVDGITLLGAEVEPGETLTNELELLKLTLYWQVTDDNLPDYDIAIRLVNQDGSIPIEFSEPPVDGNYSTGQWASGEVIRDVHSTWIDGSLPAGEYTVEVGVISSTQEEPIDWLRVIKIERQLP